MPSNCGYGSNSTTRKSVILAGNIDKAANAAGHLCDEGLI
jgi:hypothetical protein